MIFVTTGTQLPFDRLVEAVIHVARAFPDKQFFVQALYTHIPAVPGNVILRKLFSAAEFSEYLETAELVISHAGVGSIISSAQLQKVLILFPRSGKLKEHRNDHQMATCNMLKATYPLHVATTAAELSALVQTYYSHGLTPMRKIGEHASPELLGSLKAFIGNDAQILPLPT